MKNLQGILVVMALVGLSFTSCNNAQRDWPGDEVKVGKVKADTASFSAAETRVAAASRVAAMYKAKLNKLPPSNVNRQSADSTETLRKAR